MVLSVLDNAGRAPADAIDADGTVADGTVEDRVKDVCDVFRDVDNRVSITICRNSCNGSGTVSRYPILSGKCPTL